MRVTVYIRKENEQRWSELENKSDWVNDQLTGEETSFERKVKKVITDNMQMIVEALRGY